MRFAENHTPSDLNAEAFIAVGRQTSMPTFALINCAETWADSIRSKSKNSTKIVTAKLNETNWSWSRFNAMQDELLADDLWPTPWHHYEAKVKAREGLREVQAKIFIQTARTLARTLERSRDTSFAWHLRLEGWHIYTDSDVGAHYVNKRAKTVKLDDWRTWPPLYPGDLSRIEIGQSGVYTMNGKFFGLNADRPFWA